MENKLKESAVIKHWHMHGFSEHLICLCHVLLVLLILFIASTIQNRMIPSDFVPFNAVLQN